MNTRRIVGLVSAVVLTLAVLAIIMTSFPGRTTFDQAVGRSVDLPGVGSMDIIRQRHNSPEEETVKVTDPARIGRLLASLSELELQKSGLLEGKFSTVYRITLRDTEGRREAGITLYDNRHLDVYLEDSKVPKNRQASYAVKTDFNEDVINDLFK